MYGWKARIGLIIPARNTTIEPEFYKMAPDGVTAHSTRVTVREVTTSGLMDMEEEIYSVSDKMKEFADIIAVGCTSGTLIKGAGYDDRLIKNIEKITNIKAITTSTAVIHALKALQIKKVAVATPYNDEVNEKEKKFIEDNGFKVTSIKGLGYYRAESSYPLAPKPVSGIGLLEPYVAYKMAQDIDSDDSEAIFISCTNLRTIEIIASLEQNQMKPVVTSNQATMWLAIKTLGIKEKINGYGSLMENYL